jgi:hypothetical protein
MLVMPVREFKRNVGRVTWEAPTLSYAHVVIGIHEDSSKYRAPDNAVLLECKYQLNFM